MEYTQKMIPKRPLSQITLGLFCSHIDRRGQAADARDDGDQRHRAATDARRCVQAQE